MFTIAAMGLFMVDCAVIDPIPFVDEAALLYALIQGIRVIATRRGLDRQSLPEGQQEVTLEGQKVSQTA